MAEITKIHSKDFVQLNSRDERGNESMVFIRVVDITAIETWDDGSDTRYADEMAALVTIRGGRQWRVLECVGFLRDLIAS